MTAEKIKYPLKNKLIILVLVAMVPILYITIYLIMALLNYSRAYDQIVSSMTVANNYNINFKEEMDESLYKLVVSNVTFDTIEEDGTFKDPYKLIEELREGSNNLLAMTRDRESRIWLQSLLRSIDTLEDRVNDIKQNKETDGQYEESIDMLYNDIYILTELIQDDIQQYIYYQTRSIEQLKIQLNEEVEHVIFISILLGICIVAAVILITSAILNSITKPIQELCRITSQIAEGNFSDRAKMQTKDELEVLSDSVNDMSENLEVMVHQIKEDERKMRHAELRLLQEQINPHFLYNTLDTMSSIAEVKDCPEVSMLSQSLSNIFRYSLNMKDPFSTVAKEIVHLKNYCYVMDVRMQDHVQYYYDIDPESLKARVPRISIQPLVENALNHGLRNKRGEKQVRIGAKVKEELLEICVADNGVGMDAEKMNKSLKQSNLDYVERGNSIGIHNINARLKILYGEEYGLHIESMIGEGTRVWMVIPKIEGEPEKDAGKPEAG